ncbi:MAG: hypothetical protein AAGU27_22005 [Dehalobacterium sp.]
MNDKMNNKIEDQKEDEKNIQKKFLDYLEEQRKILELCAEKTEREKGNYHHDSLVRVSKQIDEIILKYFRNIKTQNKC